ncbi:hypothetical protein BGX29_006920 [Mortierella sp. GBA35]|nr:hypothetical protein BGX29_006920 [Mortierella sp. GBA35]
MFNTQNVLLANPQAIQHVFGAHAYKYPKPDRVIRLMSSIIGTGVLMAEGDVHRRQRKTINPAFNHKYIKEIVPVMDNIAALLGKQWEDRVDQSENRAIEMNVVLDLSSCTLDIIGLTGFGYDPQALTAPGNELVMAYRHYFSKGAATIERVTTQTIRDRRAQANDKNADEGKNLMSILIRANDHVDSSEADRLSDIELRDQIMTIMGAGRETTSVALAWMLHALSTHQDVQKKARQEMLVHFGRPTDANRTPLTYDSLDALPYLNACVKELLRYICPAHITSRVATEEDNILGYDIPKGTHIYLSTAALHKLKHVFGEDAEEFKPEQWMDPKLLTEEERCRTKFVTSDMSWTYIPFFLGPRNCIGSKFAVVELKIILYYLLINLEYHPVPGFKFRKSARITLRPSPGMNLIIKRYSDHATGVEP